MDSQSVGFCVHGCAALACVLHVTCFLGCDHTLINLYLYVNTFPIAFFCVCDQVCAQHGDGCESKAGVLGSTELSMYSEL